MDVSIEPTDRRLYEAGDGAGGVTFSAAKSGGDVFIHFLPDGFVATVEGRTLLDVEAEIAVQAEDSIEDLEQKLPGASLIKTRVGYREYGLGNSTALSVWTRVDGPNVRVVTLGLKRTDLTRTGPMTD